MRNGKGDTLTIFQQENGFLLARMTHVGSSVRVTELLSIPTHEITGNPYTALSSFRSEKKGFRDVNLVVSSSAFRHCIHEPETASKTKNADYIPEVVKQWLGTDKEDFFFQVIDWATGNLVAVENPQSKLMLIGGMKTGALEQLQRQILDADFFPRRLESSVFLMLGLLKKLIQTGKVSGPVMLLELFEESGVLFVLPAEGEPMLRQIDSGYASMYEQIKKELSLKDNRSARKLLYSSTIDLSDIGQQVIRPVYREIASIVGLFEVETGQSISQMVVANGMPSQHWVFELLSKDLGMNLLSFDPRELGEMVGVEFDEAVEWIRDDNRILPLVAAMGVL
ncbi:MAG: hypothetical protein ABQ298_12940 [Puniceicoccaceae bacterium]